MNIRLRRVFVYLLFVAGFLPYIKSSPLNSDVQPHFVATLLFSMLVSQLFVGRLHLSYTGAYFALVYCVLAIVFKSPFADVVSIAVLFTAISVLARITPTNLGVAESALKVVVVAYFVVGFAQLIGVDFFNFAVANIRTSETRGVPSLASEPSYYGLVALALVVALEVYSLGRVRGYQFLALCNVALSGSMTAIVPTFAVVMIYFLSKYKLKGAIYVLLLALVVVIGLMNHSGRAGKLFNYAVNDPNALLEDVSLVNRLSRSVGAMVVAYEDRFFPHSFVGLSSDLSASPLSNIEFLSGEVTRLSNIASVFVYGFGLLSLPLLLYLFFIRKHLLMPPYLLLAIFVLITANISIASPFVLFVLLAPYVLMQKLQIVNTIPTRGVSGRH